MGKKLNKGFKSTKQKERLFKLSSGLKSRRLISNPSNLSFGEGGSASVEPAALDHAYFHLHKDSDIRVPVEENEQIFYGTDSWREGRRIIDLGILAEGLSACKKCGQPLQLHHATDINNYGLSAIIKVYKKVGLSPGYHTKRLANLRDLKAKKRRALTSLKKHKLKRLELRNRRSKLNSVAELREGTSYSTGVDLTAQGSDISEIPPPRDEPSDIDIPNNTKDFVFDLETTGLERNSHITQIAVVCGEDHWQCYVMPKKPISPNAAHTTGITIRNGQMYHYENVVEAKSISTALDEFMEFIARHKSGNVILSGHNIKSYDCHVLINAINAVEKMEAFTTCVAGFLDTKILIRAQHPGLSSYSQENLVDYFLKMKYQAHDALQDVIHLQKVLNSLECDAENRKKATFSTGRAIYSSESVLITSLNLPSLQPLVDKKIISVSMSKKIAGSNLNYSALELSYNRNEEEGIRQVLSEKCGKKPRVTNSSKIVHAIAEHFKQIACRES